MLNILRTSVVLISTFMFVHDRDSSFSVDIVHYDRDQSNLLFELYIPSSVYTKFEVCDVAKYSQS